MSHSLAPSRLQNWNYWNVNGNCVNLSGRLQTGFDEVTHFVSLRDCHKTDCRELVDIIVHIRILGENPSQNCFAPGDSLMEAWKLAMFFDIWWSQTSFAIFELRSQHFPEQCDTKKLAMQCTKNIITLVLTVLYCFAKVMNTIKRDWLKCCYSA